jgi:hypothetical protein
VSCARTGIIVATPLGAQRRNCYTDSSSMDKNQILVLALANVPTIITVLIGILLNNGRLSDLNSRFAGMETRFESRLASLEHKFDTRFDLLLSKVIDLDNRLTRIEAQRH